MSARNSRVYVRTWTELTHAQKYLLRHFCKRFDWLKLRSVSPMTVQSIRRVGKKNFLRNTASSFCLAKAPVTRFVQAFLQYHFSRFSFQKNQQNGTSFYQQFFYAAAIGFTSSESAAEILQQQEFFFVPVATYFTVDFLS